MLRRREATASSYNGTEDDDGCPDRGRVIVTDTSVEMLDMIYFEFNSAVIKPQSFAIVEQIAATLQGNPEIALVEFRGHTDERGNDDYNLKMSEERAKLKRRP